MLASADDGQLDPQVFESAALLAELGIAPATAGAAPPPQLPKRSPPSTPPSSAVGGSLPAPRTPLSLAKAGTSSAQVEQLIVKILYFRGELTGAGLARELGLSFQLFYEILDSLKLQRLLEVKRALGAGFLDMLSAVFALTETGRARATLYLDVNRYADKVPVPLEQYTELVRKQKPKKGWLTPDALRKAYSRMVVTEQILSQIGPAVSSGSSFLIYGKPGNGKTFLAEALADLDKSPVFLPYAVEYQGNIIQVYDPIYHARAEGFAEPDALGREPEYDARWVRCRRPFIVSGGELTFDMLDLHYNPVSKIYEAPLQMKANNGIYLVDDFGRQRATPAEVLNRWIVPMERRIDFLSFCTGGKATVPFEAFLVFSTNLNPDDLGDEAFLRRIRYKMLMKGPQKDEFREIFLRFCAERGLACTEELVEWFIDTHYICTGREFRRCHPRDVLTHALDLIAFHSMPNRLDEELLDEAFESCFVQEEFEL